MTELDKLKNLKKSYSILLKIVNKYALIDNQNGLLWHNIISDIIGYINFSFKENLDVHNTILIINVMSGNLFSFHRDSFNEFFVITKNKIKEKKINDIIEKTKESIFTILRDYFFESRKKVDYDIKNNRYIIKN